VALGLHNRAGMRRALLLATALAAPALAAAQAAGQIVFQTSRTNPLTVNGTECNPANGSTVTINWTPRLLNGLTAAPIGGTYIIYSSSSTNPITGTDTCSAQSTTTPVFTVGVVSDLNPLNPGGTSALISTSALIQAAGLSCASEGASVFLCIQGVQGGVNSSGSNFGIATATVTISTIPPPAPLITGINPGNNALIVFWEAGGTTTTATALTQNVQLEATPVSTTGVPVGSTVTSGRFSASPARFERLVNDQGYLVHARAFSDSDNASVISPDVLGTPQLVNDFWTTYKNAGGRDSGGCSSGLAGPLGLGVLIATLALARRRK
jgi:uncharacterized protein (TIGR03382 family)